MMTNFVRGYFDYDGIYKAIVGDSIIQNMIVKPERVSLSIGGPQSFDSNNTLVTAFGFSNEISMENGYIHINSYEKIQDTGFLSVLIRFEKGIFVPTHTYDTEKFETIRRAALEENSGQIKETKDQIEPVQDEAFDSRFFFVIIIGFAFLTIITFIVLVRVRLNRRHIYEYVKNPDKDVEVCTEIPFEDFIPSAFYILRTSEEPSSYTSLISAYLLKWFQQDLIDVRIEDASIIMKNKIIVEMDNSEEILYRFFINATDEDGIITYAEFANWKRRNGRQFEEWILLVEEIGENELLAKGYLNIEVQPVIFGLFNGTMKTYTDEGKAEIDKFFGFRKHLATIEDILTSYNSKEIDKYFIYSMLFDSWKKIFQNNRIDNELSGKIESICKFSEYIMKN